jgi:putative endopeptidase
LRNDIQNLDWMTQPTKEKALLKLAAFNKKIGFPDKWKDYSSVKIARNDLLGNVRRSNVYEVRRNRNKIGKPTDKTEWGMTPPTVNAYYNPPYTEIVFPAGILQPPYFDRESDDSVNYGAIGSVIGHEYTHGFDDQGRKFDLNGNLSDWWTAEDAKAFEERASCIADEYSGFYSVRDPKNPANDVHLNGKLTLGENIGDNGGVRVSYMAYMNTLSPEQREAKIDGFTPEQRFFVAYGNVWCQNVNEQRARTLAQTDPHSTGEFRTNGVVSNMPEFQKAFGCKQGQPMVREKQCRVW